MRLIFLTQVTKKLRAFYTSTSELTDGSRGVKPASRVIITLFVCIIFAVHKEP